MGMYADAALLDWFMRAHAKASPKKLDIGKSCIRYKKPEDMPVALLGELAARLSPKQWIELYEAKVKNARFGGGPRAPRGVMSHTAQRRRCR